MAQSFDVILMFISILFKVFQLAIGTLCLIVAKENGDRGNWKWFWLHIFLASWNFFFLICSIMRFYN